MDADSQLSLARFLAQRARRASDRRLAIDVGAGFLAALAFVLWRGPYWFLLACAGVAFGAYGTWGIVDRELGEVPAEHHQTMRTALRAARVVAAILVALAILSLIFGVPAALVGTWIS
jgi:fatty acid desaturase